DTFFQRSDAVSNYLRQPVAAPIKKNSQAAQAATAPINRPTLNVSADPVVRPRGRSAAEFLKPTKRSGFVIHKLQPDEDRIDSQELKNQQARFSEEPEIIQAERPETAKTESVGSIAPSAVGPQIGAVEPE